ncbi:hypothetical protein IQ255_13245 [Pleurocapsales cyanobacterium LEGE 10410]|nr:hypothetical protein [Pleurocapsales cyanobacterium LEGE 10410]
MSVRWKLALIINLVSWLKPSWCLALPPAEDIPEEVLRTEIILEGRSPIDSEPLSAAEYEELKAELAQKAFSPEISSDIQRLIFLLQVRKLIKTIVPFY